MRQEEHPQKQSIEAPQCLVVALPGIGERRVYQGLLQPFTPHAHDYYVIGLIKEGSRRLTCNGENVLLEPGDLVVFNPGDFHGCEGVDQQRFAFDSITVQAHLFDNHRLTGPKITDETAITGFKQILGMIEPQKQSRREDASDEGDLLESLLSLGSLLTCEDTINTSTGTNASANEASARNVHAYFRSHLSETITLRQCAARVELSPYALIRAYTATFGTTPMQHLLSLRVEKARELLSQGVEPNAAVEPCGFADQAHLTREFKKRLGVTPGVYRRMTSKAKRSA